MSNLNNLPSVVAYITDKLAIPFLWKAMLKDGKKVVKLSIEPILRLITSARMINKHHSSREIIHSTISETNVTKATAKYCFKKSNCNIQIISIFLNQVNCRAVSKPKVCPDNWISHRHQGCSGSGAK